MFITQYKTNKHQKYHNIANEKQLNLETDTNYHTNIIYEYIYNTINCFTTKISHVKIFTSNLTKFSQQATNKISSQYIFRKIGDTPQKVGLNA